jgi:hypothetical protein
LAGLPAASSSAMQITDDFLSFHQHPTVTMSPFARPWSATWNAFAE